MVRIIGAVIVLLAVGFAGIIGYPAYRRQATERKAIRRLKALKASCSGRVVGPGWLRVLIWRLRGSLPIMSLTGVNSVSPEFGDEDLALLRYSTRIGNLDLDRTQVTDGGMVYLKNLREMTTLELCGTRVTDAGLAQLKHLISLRIVTLRDTGVTDAGLAHLTGLRNLLKVDVTNTAVTEAGIARLEQALPETEIAGP